MKYTLIIALVLIVGGGLYWYGTTTQEAGLGEDSQINDQASYDVFSSAYAGFMFEYKVSPDGYVVEDLSPFISADDADVLQVFRVINEREKIELDNSEVGREGPPTISLMVFENNKRLTASQWVDTNSRFSNINFLMGQVDRDAVVGGTNAVRYRTDGLYLNDNVVVAHGDYMYHFSGSFLEENSMIHLDFKRLIGSVAFIPVGSVPTGVPSSKINPQVACERALIYMTFESGAAADAFVKACVNGEHPEVIEQYINDMGLDGATI